MSTVVEDHEGETQIPDTSYDRQHVVDVLAISHTGVRRLEHQGKLTRYRDGRGHARYNPVEVERLRVASTGTVTATPKISVGNKPSAATEQVVLARSEEGELLAKSFELLDGDADLGHLVQQLKRPLHEVLEFAEDYAFAHRCTFIDADDRAAIEELWRTYLKEPPALHSGAPLVSIMKTLFPLHGQLQAANARAEQTERAATEATQRVAQLEADLAAVREDSESIRAHAERVDNARNAAVEQADAAEARSEKLERYADQIERERDEVRAELLSGEQLRQGLQQQLSAAHLRVEHAHEQLGLTQALTVLLQQESVDQTLLQHARQQLSATQRVDLDRDLHELVMRYLQGTEPGE